MKSGIYTITNLVNDKIYIGRSKNYNQRLIYHKSSLKCNKHYNQYLQKAYNKYGEKNFVFELLEECKPEFLCSMEHYWCNLLNTHDKNYGYNIDPTSPFGRISHSKETKKKMSDAANRTERIDRVIKLCKERIKSKAELEKLSKILKIRINNGSLNIGKRPIIQLDENNNEINKFNSIAEASRFTKIKRTSISNNLSGLSKTAGKFKWKYLTNKRWNK